LTWFLSSFLNLKHFLPLNHPPTPSSPLTGYRIEALEEQLENSAQDAAKEIARLRTRLFEFEMAAALNEEDDDLLGEDEAAGEQRPSSQGILPSGAAVKAANALRNTDTDSLEETARASVAEGGQSGEGGDPEVTSPPEESSPPEEEPTNS
jgi:hypothetical protein